MFILGGSTPGHEQSFQSTSLYRRVPCGSATKNEISGSDRVERTVDPEEMRKVTAAAISPMNKLRTVPFEPDETFRTNASNAELW